MKALGAITGEIGHDAWSTRTRHEVRGELGSDDY